MQSLRENTLDAGASETSQGVARMALARAPSPIVVADEVQMPHQDFVAVRERTGQLAVQDEEIGDKPWFHALSVNPMVRGNGRNLAEDRSPLEVVEGSSDPLRLGKEQM